MKKVRVLPPEIVSKIAAGEVIERPASVVKELVENSLDAGSSSIEIIVNKSGKQRIVIKDNGSGIAHEDIETIFLRHATSKIETVDDLYMITSLGFRGEALYSIASVSDVIVRSKVAAEESGWEINIRANKTVSHKPFAMEHGTEIEIKELFFNTPARKKFLKKDVTEFNQILNTVIPYTIAHPACRFILMHNDKIIFDLLPVEDRVVRISNVLNLDRRYIHDTESLPVSNDESYQLYLGDVNIQRTRKDLQHVFVNNRPVYSRNLAYQMNQVYRLLMPQGVYSSFAVFLNIPPQNVDVNVHPRKHEVKIRDEQSLFSFIKSRAEEILMATGDIKQMTKIPFTGMDGFDRSNVYGRQAHSTFVGEPQYSKDYIAQATQNLLDKELFSNNDRTPDEGFREKLQHAIFVGIFRKKYLMYETGKSLLFIDQHAGQERITYESLKKQIASSSIEKQSLLSPIVITVSPQEMIVWEEAKETINNLGFSTTLWDRGAIAIHEHPVLIRNPEQAVRSLLAEEKSMLVDEDIVARKACRASVMAGDYIDRAQADLLRDNLLKCDDPFSCPHGRPTVVELKEDFINRQFLRC